MTVPVSMLGQRGASGARANQHDVVARSPMLVLMGEMVGIGERVNMVVLDLDQLARRSDPCSEPAGRHVARR